MPSSLEGFPFDDFCEEYGIGSYELPEMLYKLMEGKFIEIEGVVSELEKNGFDVGDMFKCVDVGSKDEPGGWDIFFGDDDE